MKRTSDGGSCIVDFPVFRVLGVRGVFAAMRDRDAAVGVALAYFKLRRRGGFGLGLRRQLSLRQERLTKSGFEIVATLEISTAVAIGLR